MQSTVGDLCSVLILVITEEVKTLQPDNSPRRKGRLAAGCGSLGSQRIKSSLAELTRISLGLVACQNDVQ